MKIGVSLTSSFPKRIDARTAGRLIVERAAAIRAAGLDSIVVGDHHATPTTYFQNVPMLARILGEVGDMTVGALFLVPLHHPVLMAEQVGTLAAFADGPFVLIAAAGDDPAQFDPFGVPLKTRPSRLEEHLSIVRRLLSGERVTHHGRYHTLSDVVINPTPPQPVPVWIAASAGAALERAGRMADGWLASPGAYGEGLTAALANYRASARRHGRTAEAVIRRDVYCGESDAEAEESAAAALAAGYRGLHRDALIIGGPETVAAEFEALAQLGFAQVLVRHIVTDQAKVLASYRRLGAEVLPRVRGVEGRG